MLELTVSAAPQAVEPVEREIAVKAASSAVRRRLGRCSFMRRGERRLVEMRRNDAGKAAERVGKAMPGDNATKALRA